MFATGLKVFGGLAMFVGLMTIAGSAGDCDGKCMDQANDMATMLTLIGYGLIAMLGGFATLMAGVKISD